MRHERGDQAYRSCGAVRRELVIGTVLQAVVGLAVLDPGLTTAIGAYGPVVSRYIARANAESPVISSTR